MHILTPTVDPWPSCVMDAVITFLIRCLIKSLTASWAHQSIFTVWKLPAELFRSEVPSNLSLIMAWKSAAEGQADPLARCIFEVSCWTNCHLWETSHFQFTQVPHLACGQDPWSQGNCRRHFFHSFISGGAMVDKTDACQGHCGLLSNMSVTVRDICELVNFNVLCCVCAGGAAQQSLTCGLIWKNGSSIQASQKGQCQQVVRFCLH